MLNFSNVLFILFHFIKKKIAIGIHILNENIEKNNDSALNFSKFEKKSSSICFEVITSYSSNKIRLQQIFKINDVYNATVLVNYTIEGFF